MIWQNQFRLCDRFPKIIDEIFNFSQLYVRLKLNPFLCVIVDIISYILALLISKQIAILIFTIQHLSYV